MIAKNEEFHIPLKKLWCGYRLLFPKQKISLEEFEQTLRKDERFLFAEKHLVQKSVQEIPDETEVMESLGFFSGPVVSLKSRQPTEDDIASSIDRTFARLLSALSRMWEARDPLDKSTEESLNRVIEKAKTLYSSFQKTRIKKAGRSKHKKGGFAPPFRYSRPVSYRLNYCSITRRKRML